jgi:hypothetical protein
VQLAYLLVRDVSEESWSGGLLVTDRRGLPLDFRYIEPIHPNRLQKLIYGSALKRYLLLDAIAATLLKAANPNAEWIFTSDPMLLEMNGQTNGQFVAISNGENKPLNGVGEWRAEGPGKIILQVRPTGPPARLLFEASSDEETEKIAQELSHLSLEMDFAEPLDRVGEALIEICRNGRD